MKKKTINAFTLVEMLIVIVIIGILIAALMPRMQAAQWRARDVARKTALSQIQSALVTSQWDNWYWPWQCANVDANTTNCAEDGTGINSVETSLKTAWMNSVPVDPLKSSEVWWLWNFDWDEAGNYSYLVTKRNWTPNGGFVLMAKTEVEWGSNWIVCPEEANGCDAVNAFDPNGTNNWCIPANNVADITDIHPCTSFHKITDAEAGTLNCGIVEATNTCNYRSDGQLRYIVLY